MREWLSLNCSLQDRTGLSPQKQAFAKKYKALKNLEEIVMDLKPSAIIGEFPKG